MGYCLLLGFPQVSVAIIGFTGLQSHGLSPSSGLRGRAGWGRAGIDSTCTFHVFPSLLRPWSVSFISLQPSVNHLSFLVFFLYSPGFSWFPPPFLVPLFLRVAFWIPSLPGEGPCHRTGRPLQVLAVWIDVFCPTG